MKLLALVALFVGIGLAIAARIAREWQEDDRLSQFDPPTEERFGA